MAEKERWCLLDVISLFVSTWSYVRAFPDTLPPLRLPAIIFSPRSYKIVLSKFPILEPSVTEELLIKGSKQ